jgi:hypothetical protein
VKCFIAFNNRSYVRCFIFSSYAIFLLSNWDKCYVVYIIHEYYEIVCTLFIFLLNKVYTCKPRVEAKEYNEMQEETRACYKANLSE